MQGKELAESAHTVSFAEIEAARGDISLTYFEYGTLSALWLFKQANLDVVILEVGLGGRTDATNIVDADVAVITSIALDHTDWLGPDRESIGREGRDFSRGKTRYRRRTGNAGNHRGCRAGDRRAVAASRR